MGADDVYEPNKGASVCHRILQGNWLELRRAVRAEPHAHPTAVLWFLSAPLAIVIPPLISRKTSLSPAAQITGNICQVPSNSYCTLRHSLPVMYPCHASRLSVRGVPAGTLLRPTHWALASSRLTMAGRSPCCRCAMTTSGLCSPAGTASPLPPQSPHAYTNARLHTDAY